MKHTILIIDDSKSILEMTYSILKEAGYDVITAQDGTQGLAEAMQNNISLALIDINMPGMDGISLIKTLRKLPEYQYTPLLVFTNEFDIDKKKQGKEAGATGWLVKPLSPEQILHSVRRVFSN